MLYVKRVPIGKKSAAANVRLNYRNQTLAGRTITPTLQHMIGSENTKKQVSTLLGSVDKRRVRLR